MIGSEKLMVASIGSDDPKLERAETVHEDGFDAIAHAVIDGEEAWIRTGTEPHFGSVEAVRNAGGGWSVEVAAMEFVRPEHAIYQELRQAIEDAITSVPGVTELEREVDEVWWASGSPSGKDLVSAVAHVIDAHAHRLRDHYSNLSTDAQ